MEHKMLKTIKSIVIAASIISSVACGENIDETPPAPETCTAALEYGDGTVYIDTDCEGIDSMYVLVSHGWGSHTANMDFSRFFMLGTVTGQTNNRTPDYICVELIDADGFEMADACWFQE
jgi:hypothetical protein